MDILPEYKDLFEKFNINKDNFNFYGFLFIHKVIKRNQYLFTKKLNSLSDDSNLEDLNKWFEKFSTLLLVHHNEEDKVFFPILETKVKDCIENIIHFNNEHEALDDIINNMRKGFEINSLFEIKRRNYLLQKLIDHHLHIEEEILLPIIMKYFSTKEQRNIEKKIQFITPLKYLDLLLPMMVESLDENEGKLILKDIPFFIKPIYKNIWLKEYLKIKKIVEINP